MIGFAVHPSKKWQAGRAVFVSVSAFVAILAMILTEDAPFWRVVRDKPAYGVAAVLFLFFSLILISKLQHILTVPLILEFTEKAIIDHRRAEARVIPYSLIEVFSPNPDELFSRDPKVIELRPKAGIEDFVRISCRLRMGRSGDKPSYTEDFVFVERIVIPDIETRQKILSRLREKISRFELLEQDDGTGFGDDETNF